MLMLVAGLPRSCGNLAAFREICKESRDLIFEIFSTPKVCRENVAPVTTLCVPCLTKRSCEASACNQVSRDRRLENRVCRNWISMLQKLDID
ncbi:hypothetical protein [Thauera sp.]|uniref:hypothetical protein n=1 Tax=Thauera sp. TaxID=1905334 RepID=UPI002B810C69|nr:hypothetical protein [Thauera sp.]HRP26407.1 hypothetical protein [Thauera sp.]